MPSDPPPDRILIGQPNSPVECRHVAKIHLVLSPDATEAYRAELEERFDAILTEVLGIEVSVAIG